MSSDLIALIVAIALGAVVVGLGLRRNLADSTRDWLPRPGEGLGREAATLGPPEGERRHRPLSPRQGRWMGSFYLLIGLWNATQALLSADDRLFHAIMAPLWVLAAVAFLLGKWPRSVEASTS